MRLSADSIIRFPREVVFAAYRDELPALVEFLPNIRRIEVTSRSDEAPVSRLVNVWHGGGDVPAAARSVLSESMLSWTDHATWNGEDYTCDWRIETHSFREAVSCRGKNLFVEVPEGTRLEIRGDLSIDPGKVKGVPRILAGTVMRTVEDFLVKRITPNLLEVSSGLERYLTRKLRP